MIRITSGKFRGRSIESPPRSKAVRPTTSLIRESIFSRFPQRWENMRFLDLFAGSGIMSLEALSRGASFTLAVELDKRQCRKIQDYFRDFKLTPEQAKAVPVDVRELLAKPCRKAPFDWVFLDPPYGFEGLDRLAVQCVSNGWVKPNGVIMVEHGIRDLDIPGFSRRDYGDSSISVLVLSEV